MGTRSCDVSDGYKLSYNSTPNKQNGVATAVLESFRDKIFLVARISDRPLAVKIRAGSKTMNVVAAHSPQTESIKNDKINFRMDICDFICTVTKHESILLEAHLNECDGRLPQQWNPQQKEERTFEFEVEFGVVMANMQLKKKKDEFLITFAIGKARLQGFSS